MTSLALASDAPHLSDAFGKGVYSATEAIRLVQRREPAHRHSVARQTVERWLRGYAFGVDGEIHHMEPLWKSDLRDRRRTDFRGQLSRLAGPKNARRMDARSGRAPRRRRQGFLFSYRIAEALAYVEAGRAKGMAAVEMG